MLNYQILYRRLFMLHLCGYQMIPNKCLLNRRQAHLNLIGNQSAVPGDSHSKLVISTGWLASHEVQFKNATVKQVEIIIIHYKHCNADIHKSSILKINTTSNISTQTNSNLSVYQTYSLREKGAWVSMTFLETTA